MLASALLSGLWVPGWLAPFKVVFEANELAHSYEKRNDVVMCMLLVTNSTFTGLY